MHTKGYEGSQLSGDSPSPLSFTIELMVSFLILLLLVSLPQYANAVLLPNTPTRTSLDTEKPCYHNLKKPLMTLNKKSPLSGSMLD